MTKPLIAPNANDPREDGPSAGEDAAWERRIIARVEVLMLDARWWDEAFSGDNPLNMTIEGQMPRLMANLDIACKEGISPVSGVFRDPTPHYAREAILASLSIIQREARHRARKQAEGECE